MSAMKRVSKVLAAGALFALGGCAEYKYVDVHATFDPAMFDISITQQLNFCRVTVSGADSGKFRLPAGRCPNRVTNSAGVVENPLDAGTFEFSTFADSGTITFKLEGFTSPNEDATCITASGEKAVKITGEQTIKDTLVISRVAGGKVCNTTAQ